MGETQALGTSRVRALIVVIIILAFAAASTYAVMSDVSVRGLTVRISNPTRTCPIDPLTDTKIVTFYLSASVYSTQSLRTTVSQVRLQLSADGVALGTKNVTDKAFDPGQGANYALSFQDPALDPSRLPASTTLVLAITAQVSAGIYSMKITASDSQTVSSGNGC